MSRHFFLANLFLLVFIFSAITSDLAAEPAKFQYDSAGRLIRVEMPNGSNNQIVYDALGNIVEQKKNLVGTIWISTFSPGSAPVGLSTIIEGAGFSEIPDKNVVKLNGVQAKVTKATSTQLTVTVPPGSTTGKVTVENANGIARSDYDFIVPTLIANAPPLTISLAPNQTAHFTISGSIGDGFAILASSIWSVPIDTLITIRGPNTSCTSSRLRPQRLHCDLSYLAVAGNHEVTVTAGKGSSTLAISLASDSILPIAVNGPSVTALSEFGGRVPTLGFMANAGQRELTILFSDNTYPDAMELIVFSPDGTVLASKLTSGMGSFVLPTLPLSGAYKLRIKPRGGVTGSVTIALQQDALGELEVDGSAFPMVLNSQIARYTFNGRAGQRLGLGYFGLESVPRARKAFFTIFSPAGNLLVECSTATESGGCVVPQLPMDGTYKVVVKTGGTAMTGKLQLLSDLSIPLAVGNVVTTSLAKIGQTITYNFDGVSTKKMNLAISGVTVPDLTSFALTKPDGQPLRVGNNVYYASGTPGSTNIILDALPLTGTYLLRVLLVNGGIGSISASLLQDVQGSLSVDAAPTPLALTLPNQQGRFTFSGVKNQRLGLGFTSLATVPAGGVVAVTILRPDGVEIGNCTISMDVNSCLLRPLPITGTYTVLIVSPSNSVTGSLVLSSDAEGLLDPAAPEIRVATTKPGQAVTYRFNGITGQRLGLGFAGLTAQQKILVTITMPSGNDLISPWEAKASSKGYVLPRLPEPGSYFVRISVANGTILTQMKLSEDSNQPLQINGPSVTATIAYPGQGASFSFDGKAGQRLSLATEAGTLPDGSDIAIYQPDGTRIDGTYTAYRRNDHLRGRVNINKLPVTGTYTARVLPYTAATGSITLVLVESVSATLEVNAAATAIGFSNQNGHFTFLGKKGQSLNLKFTNLNITESFGSISLGVYDPTGERIKGGYVIGPNEDYIFPILQIDGIYRIEMYPAGSKATGFMQLRSPP